MIYRFAGQSAVSPRTITKVGGVVDESSLKPRLIAYLAEQTGHAWTLGSFTRFAVGFSWITYGFSATPAGESQARGLILRLGPADGLFAPYSALPEYSALKALEGQGVPAPRAFWWSDDASILGAPFCITEKVEGSAPVPWGGADAFAASWRTDIGLQFVSALAGIHRIDWRGREGFDQVQVTEANAAHVQLDYWESARQRWALRAYPMLHHAMLWLRRNAPVAPRVSLVHGDYRLGNFLEQDGRITAILDWELVHLGDPHEDLGWAFLPQFAMGSGRVCGLVAQEDFIARYEAEVGFSVDPASLHFYRVLALVKLALTHMAGVRCFEDGRFDDMRMPAMGTQVMPVLRQIEKILP
ncbi:phosphotransferase family protein [Pseudomonas aeruginosa]|nr:phosphotransferase family protein [Pseudomonas aeruginosa]TJY58716.1 phosphotransferase family protein [Pseudomonas aeruginosa]